MFRKCFLSFVIPIMLGLSLLSSTAMGHGSDRFRLISYQGYLVVVNAHCQWIVTDKTGTTECGYDKPVLKSDGTWEFEWQADYLITPGFVPKYTPEPVYIGNPVKAPE